ncbi:hypothetical protein [Tateyamaria sp. SN3-11]|uniref:hypothetical protein n=1 Tax=Tateyamaria sp. SN3-11 TaxID=3092147 RepID=UPI0039ED404C
MPKRKTKTSFLDIKQGWKNVGSVVVQAGKEYSSIPAYAFREFTDQPHHKKVKCSLKKGWFE